MYRAVNTLRIGYKIKSLHSVQENNRCFFLGSIKITETQPLGRM
jgi:hypothetical protein